MRAGSRLFDSWFLSSCTMNPCSHSKSRAERAKSPWRCPHDKAVVRMKSPFQIRTTVALSQMIYFSASAEKPTAGGGVVGLRALLVGESRAGVATAGTPTSELRHSRSANGSGPLSGVTQVSANRSRVIGMEEVASVCSGDKSPPPIGLTSIPETSFKSRSMRLFPLRTMR